jgi:hypothetical protein
MSQLRAKGYGVFLFQIKKYTKEEKISMIVISLPGFKKVLDLTISDIKRTKEIRLSPTTITKTSKEKSSLKNMAI